jgi:hypothetical protein
MFRTLWSRPFSRKVRSSRCRPAKPGRCPGFRPSIELLEGRVLLAGLTYWVLNTADNNGVNPPPGAGTGTLRQAIVDANFTAGLDKIAFDIGGGGVQTISLKSALPAITDPVILDGTTEPGSAGLPAVELNGTMAGFADGLVIVASNTVVKGLVINRFTGNGIVVGSAVGFSPTNVVITDNYIGTDSTGTSPSPNQKNGVLLGFGVTNSFIGRVVGGAKNVISGNMMDGVRLDPGTAHNVVAGNYIGTDVTGTTAYDFTGSSLGNGNNGVHLVMQANDNTIGGVGAGAKNVISGNVMDGVRLEGPSVTSNLVANNYIGTDVSGTVALGNGNDGVHLLMGASSNTIEGVGAGANSIISGNGYDGICLDGTDYPVMNNLVEGNFVGTDVTGTRPLGNGRDGVRLFARANNNTIKANLLSANGEDGLDMAGINVDLSPEANLVQGNLIGTDATGTTAYDPASTLPLGNGRNGVSLHDGAHRNTIGGVGGGLGNIISGNAQDGINFDDEGIAPVTDNLVQGNYIGTDITGTWVSDSNNKPLGNGYGVPVGGDGVNLAFTSAGGAISNTIGGTAYGAGNVISGNHNDGVMISGSPNAGFSNLVRGNYIGTPVTGLDATGMPAADIHGVSFGNGNNGVEIVGAPNNLIGGLPGPPSASDAPNVIAHNGGFGVLVSGTTAIGNTISKNSILLNDSPSGVGIVSPPQAPSLAMAMYFPPPVNMMTVTVALTSVPAGIYRIEFFANLTSAADCEGWLYIGFWQINAPTLGVTVTFNVLSIPIPPGYNCLSATATYLPTGSTSPFSDCIPIMPIMPSPAPSGSLSAGNSPPPAASPVPAWVALSRGAQTASAASTAGDPVLPQWSVEPACACASRDWYFANTQLQRDLAALLFGSPDRGILPGDPEREALPAHPLSRLAPPLEAGWDFLSQGEPSLFDN